MASLLSLPSVQPFSTTDQSNLGQRWSKWVKSFEYYIAASGVTDKKRQRAILLHLAGPSVQDIFDTLADTGDDYDTAVAKLTAYFEPKRNIPFERNKFRQATQGETETMDFYITRLQLLAATCEFGDSAEELIRDQVVDKCASSKLRRRFLREPDLTLDKIRTIARASEDSARQASTMEQPQPTPVNLLQRRGPTTSGRSPGQRWQTRRPRDVSQPCYCCGQSGHIAKDPKCPALNVTCNGCGKFGHFKHVCRSGGASASRLPNKVQYVATDDFQTSQDFDDSDSEDEYAYTVHTQRQPESIAVDIQGHEIDMIIDSGASVNVIDANRFKALSRKGLTLSNTNMRLFTYGSRSPLEVEGKFQAEISANGRTVSAPFIVVGKNHAGCLLGRTTATELNVLRVGPEVGINSVSQDTLEPLLSQFEDLFYGIGKLKDFQLQLHIDANVQPVAQAPGRTPFNIRSLVEDKLSELEQLDIIEKVDGPTPWVSPLVPVPKSSGEIRICVDMRQANEAVKRERHPIPTVEETLQELHGACVFSKLDLKWGYHQIELAPESRIITTFATHAGLWRYKRLMFGISSAPEIYQHVIQQTLQGCTGARNISDDILVYGKTKSEHDSNLKQVLQRLKENGLTLNKDKCLFGVPEITFFGLKISAAGVSPEDRKVNAIKDARAPRNPSEVRSFLGLATYCSRFIPNFATIAEPLRRLTRHNTDWEWAEEQQAAFDRLKSMLTSDCVMAHYDQAAPTQLRVDASPVGLGAILTQTHNGVNKPVAYASRALTDVEQRYSQTEREALAVVWGCEKFHLYLYGAEFDLYTDHKALEVIYSPKAKPPARIERWVLRLQPYRYKVIYTPGQANPADMLSRFPLGNQPIRHRSIAEEYINFVTANATPKAVTLDEIARESEKDPILQQVRRCIANGVWAKTPGLEPYHMVRQSLSTKRGLILYGHCLVIPENLQQTVLQAAHEGHQGIVRTKQMLREKVWWPGINQQVENLIKSCIPCQAVASPIPPEPLRPTPMPHKPWQVVHIDLCGPFPTGESLLVTVDSCSRWPEVDILRSTTAEVIIKKLCRTFAAHGMPEKVITDNGPQFVSNTFKEFLTDNGIQHQKITPYWPQTNSEVERFNRTIEKAIRTAHAEGKVWQMEIHTFLLNYRATPHGTTGVSPAKLLYGRDLRTKVPVLREPVAQPDLQKALRRDEEVKQKTKVYMDERLKAVPCDIQAGDLVLLKQQNHRNKLTPNYDPKPFVVVRRRGASVILKRGSEKTIMRNITFVRKLPPNAVADDYHQSTDEDDDDPSVTEPPPERGQPTRQNLRRTISQRLYWS